jgi:hypothetical protein
MMTTLIRQVGHAVMLLVLVLGGAARADVTVTATADPMRVYLGDTFVLQITVEGASSAKTPDLSRLADLECTYVGGQDRSSRSVTIINGRRSEQVFQGYVMQWRVRPLKAGRVKVPSVQVDVNGVMYSTKEIVVTVREPTDHADFKLRLICDRTTAYVGEPIPMRLVWYIGREVEPAVFSGSDGGDVFDIVPSTEAKALADQRSNPRSPYRNVQFVGGTAVGVLGQGVLEGRSFTTLTLEFSVIPKRAGEIEVGPYAAAFDATMGAFRSERVVIACEKVVLRVSALPDVGKPAGFNGLIGRFTIEASAGVSEANVGDPVTLTVSIKGTPPMDRVKAPELELIPGFPEGFKGSPEGWEVKKDGAASERVFTTTIRPKSDAVTAIPSIPLSFFDTETGAYRTAATAPIPLKVRPTREVTVADAVVGAKSIAGPGAYTLTPGGLAMRGNYAGEELLVNQRVDALAVLTSPVGMGVVLMPPLALAGVVVVRHLRSRGRGTSERVRLAAQRARAGLRHAECVDEVSRCVREFVGEVGCIPANAVTSRDARCLAALEPESAAKVATCLERCEAAAYSGEEAEWHDLRGEAGAALDAIVHGVKGGGR